MITSDYSHPHLELIISEEGNFQCVDCCNYTNITYNNFVFPSNIKSSMGFNTKRGIHLREVCEEASIIFQRNLPNKVN